MKKMKNSICLLLMVVMTLTMVGINTPQVFSATNQFRGVNWADQRDNFQSGVLYVSGLSAWQLILTAKMNLINTRLKINEEAL